MVTTKTRVQNPSTGRNATKIIPLPFILQPFIKSRHCYSQKKKKRHNYENKFILSDSRPCSSYISQSDHRWSQMEATLHFYSSFFWWYTEKHLWIFTVPCQRLMLWLLKGASVQQPNGLKTSRRTHKKRCWNQCYWKCKCKTMQKTCKTSKSCLWIIRKNAEAFLRKYV